MRTATTIFNLYRYEELSDKAKEHVRHWYLERQESDIFTEMCEEQLHSLFPNSDLKVEYSLNYCQGDGLNIYGKIDLADAMKNIEDKFTDKERKFFKWVMNEYGSTYRMPSNAHYTYCICSRNSFTENWLDGMECDHIRDIPEALLGKFSKLVGKYLDHICKEFEENGYAYFYEISDEDLQEVCEANDWEFYEDGELY